MSLSAKSKRINDYEGEYEYEIDYKSVRFRLYESE